jgi:hypothetical protein
MIPPPALHRASVERRYPSAHRVRPNLSTPGRGRRRSPYSWLQVGYRGVGGAAGGGSDDERAEHVGAVGDGGAEDGGEATLSASVFIVVFLG